jgi:hypothetical protein
MLKKIRISTINTLNYFFSFKVILFLGLIITLDISYVSKARAVNPIIAIEGASWGFNILKEVGEKVSDGLDGLKNKKKQNKTIKNEFICLNHYDKNSKNLIIGKFEIPNSNYDLCINKSSYPSLYADLTKHISGSIIAIDVANRYLSKNNHYYKFKINNNTKIVNTNTSTNSNFKKVTNELSGTSSQNFKDYTWNGLIVSQKYYCEEATKAGWQNWRQELFNKKGCNQSNWSDELQYTYNGSNSKVKNFKIDKDYLKSLPTNRRFYSYDEAVIFYKNLNLSSKVFIQLNTSSEYIDNWNNKYPNSYSSNKAWAQSSDGAWAWKTGFSAIDAAKQALDYCSSFIESGPKQCVLIKVNDKILTYEEQNYYSEKIYNKPTLIATIIKNQNQNLYANNNKTSVNYNWYASAKHPKSSKLFIATKVSNERDAKKIAIQKCYEFVSKELGEWGYKDCYIDLTVDETVQGKVAEDLLNKQKVAKVEEPKQEEFKPEKMKFCVKESMLSNLGSLVTDYKENSICEGDDFIVTENSNKALYLYLKTQYKSNNGIFYIKPLILANYKTKTDLTSESKKTEVAKVEEPKQEEFKPKSTNQDKDPPVIQIAETITVNNSDYSIEGKVSDKADRVFIEIDGQTIVADKGKFKIQRFSPIDEQIQIVAIDQWGNRSKPKTVNIKLDIKSTETALLIEKLNPTKIKNRTDNNKVALIIGIENYDQTPKATFANLDAKYFYEYANKSFGVPKGNIKLLVDDDANLIQSLGVLSKWLPGKIKNGKTDLIIFFAGHGLASVDGKELFLLPQDSDPDLLERTALSRNELFKNIIDLNPKSVTMFFDTCFSGISRDEKTLLASARPIRIAADEQEGIPENFTIFSASQLDQISSGLKEVNHGIFSYYVMKGLEGNADQNDDKQITNGELLSYLDENVSQKASELGRQQNPTLSGNPDQILARY